MVLNPEIAKVHTVELQKRQWKRRQVNKKSDTGDSGSEFHRECEKFLRQLKNEKIEFAAFSKSGNEDGKLHPTRKAVLGGKEYEFRIDHDISKAGPTFPKISTRLMNNDKKLEKLRAAYLKLSKQHKVALPVKLALERSARRMQAVNKLSFEDHQDGSKADPTLENCMLRPEILDKICEETKWVPVIDCCADPLGTNSVTALYLDVMVDALQQVDAVKGKDLVMNPPFCRCEEFIEFGEQAYEADKATRIVLIVPKRKGVRSRSWFKRLSESKQWRIVAKYPVGNPLFSEPDCQQPFEHALRSDYEGSIEQIYAWELNQHPARRSEPLEFYEKMDGEQLHFIRELKEAEQRKAAARLKRSAKELARKTKENN